MKLIALGSDETGAALAEFAVATIFLLFLALGTTDFGLIRYESSQVNRLVQKGVLYATNNANDLFLQDPFNPSTISTAVGTDKYGDTLSVSAGCACPSSSGLTASSLTPFATTGSKCSTTLDCNPDPVTLKNTTSKSAYVIISAQHSHPFNLIGILAGNFGTRVVSSTAVVRLQ